MAFRNPFKKKSKPAPARSYGRTPAYPYHGYADVDGGFTNGFVAASLLSSAAEQSYRDGSYEPPADTTGDSHVAGGGEFNSDSDSYTPASDDSSSYGGGSDYGSSSPDSGSFSSDSGGGGSYDGGSY